MAADVPANQRPVRLSHQHSSIPFTTSFLPLTSIFYITCDIHATTTAGLGGISMQISSTWGIADAEEVIASRCNDGARAFPLFQRGSAPVDGWILLGERCTRETNIVYNPFNMDNSQAMPSQNPLSLVELHPGWLIQACFR